MLIARVPKTGAALGRIAPRPPAGRDDAREPRRLFLPTHRQ